MRFAACVLVALVVSPAASLTGDETTSAAKPRPIPLTRPVMKQFLEDMKERTPRIPLPELAEDEIASSDARSRGYESRVRALYGGGRGDNRGGFATSGRTGGVRDQATLAQEGAARPRGGAAGRNSDSLMTLDYKFKTELFWIASRANNCQYCLGHQESKLLGAGMTEDEIAALDGDWREFTPAEQTAFTFGRRLTLEPHLLSDKDIEELRVHFTDLQILEMIMSVAGNNSINRWKEGIGVPQSRDGGNFGRRTADGARSATSDPQEHQSYLTRTSEKYASQITRVAAITADTTIHGSTSETICQRPALESRSDVEKALAEARRRMPRLPLVDEAKSREILGENAPAGDIPQWMRLLVSFPQTGKQNVGSIQSADETGDLSPQLKAQLSWIIARQDRAWYAAGQAKARLAELNQSDDEIFALDGDWSDFTPRERSLFTVARNLAASPIVLTDDEVSEALKLAGPKEVVQTITYTTNRASFNRLTEAAGLQIE